MVSTPVLEHTPIDLPVPFQSDSTPDVQSRNPASTPVQPAAIVQAVPTNDGLFEDHSDGPGPGDGVRQITQDKDLEPPIFDDIAHQFKRITENSEPDELFDRIEEHVWQDGLLMFRIRWKTNEFSLLPFSTVKRDFPSETTSYVLKLKLGNDSGRYIGGRYTRWARQFNRNLSKIVRRILRVSGGSYHSDDHGSPTTIRVASNLPNGTRLIRRVIRAVPTAGGVRKRKKPGRISSPLEVKYGVPIPRNVKHALELDAKAGNTFWSDAIRKEVESLLNLDCFSFHAPDTLIGNHVSSGTVCDGDIPGSNPVGEEKIADVDVLGVLTAGCSAILGE
jgi:hypothetical protein